MFAFVLGTNTVNAQEKITKLDIQQFTSEVFAEKPTAAAVEMKVLENKLYVRIQTKEKENFLLVSSLNDFHKKNVENVEVVQYKKVNLLLNYIKSYIIEKQNNTIASN